MPEFDPPGMKHLPDTGLGGFPISAKLINCIAHKRVAYMIEMDPYLMGPAGIEPDSYQAGVIIPLYHLPGRPGRSARIRIDAHPYSLPGMPIDGKADISEFGQI